ncbi:hypothetical protein VTI74DRAFT_5302 [Chaetomium olivicolor]
MDLRTEMSANCGEEVIGRRHEQWERSDAVDQVQGHIRDRRGRQRRGPHGPSRVCLDIEGSEDGRHRVTRLLPRLGGMVVGQCAVRRSHRRCSTASHHVSSSREERLPGTEGWRCLSKELPRALRRARARLALEFGLTSPFPQTCRYWRAE